MYLEKFSRCLRLLNLLQSRVGHSVQELAIELEVSRRTVYRDLRTLDEAGVAVQCDQETGGRLIVSNLKPKTLPLTDDELTLVLLAARTSPLTGNLQLGAIINQAIGKLLAQAREEVRNETAVLLKSCVIDKMQPLWCRQMDRLSSQILSAIRQRRRIRIRHCLENVEDTSGITLRTTVAPYRLVASRETWYLIGRSSWDRKICCFNLRQVLDVEITDDAYELPKKYRRTIPVPELLAATGG